MTPPDLPLLLTRPAAASARFAAAFRGRFGADWPVILSPLMQIHPCPLSLAQQDQARAAPQMIFSSAHAVAPVTAVAPARGRLAWCVGAATARAAQAAGFTPRLAEGDAASLIALIRAARPEAPLLHLRGRHIAAPVAAALRAAGIACDELTVYDQQPAPLSDPARAALSGPAPLLLPLFSPRSARLFCAARPEAPGAALRIAAISPAVAEALRPARRPEDRLSVAARPDAEAVLTALGGLITP